MTDVLGQLRFMERSASLAAAPVIKNAADEIEQLRAGLDAAIRAASLALFTIQKQGVMPNDNWRAGFEKDMTTAKSARGDARQPEQQKTGDARMQLTLKDMQTQHRAR